jgi:hypothetical protein
MPRSPNGVLLKLPGDDTTKRCGIGLFAAALTFALAAPLSAQTARDNAASAGVGAIIGGAAGATTGAALTPDDRVYVRQYVQERRVRPVRIQDDVRVGVVLPRERVTYHEIEGNPRLDSYRYAIVNDQTVLVDSGGHVVQIIE